MAFDPHTEWKKLQSAGKLRPLRAGQTDPQVALLRGALAHHGFGHLPKGSARYDPSKVFDDDLRELVKAFQFTHADRQEKRLEADGVVGPKTAWALAQEKDEAPGALKVRLLKALSDTKLLGACRRKGRAFTKGANACAATQSFLDKHLGIRTTIEDGAEEYCDAAERWVGPAGERYLKIRSPHEVKRGDIVKCRDLTDTQRGGGPNGRADHVFRATSDAFQGTDGKWWVKCFDNNTPTGYVRNLQYPLGKTPMDYALRLVG